MTSGSCWHRKKKLPLFFLVVSFLIFPSRPFVSLRPSFIHSVLSTAIPVCSRLSLPLSPQQKHNFTLYLLDHLDAAFVTLIDKP